ncbi:MAG: DUF1080 domain-containing protein, partial [Chitinivibrionales bacterium]|nr:DUF1080 domain-containing protein [Chitinivibrionales bacterium]MBD3395993.1 DUF1080 domain-containing protein [Chitinivibrionales bacterium]
KTASVYIEVTHSFPLSSEKFPTSGSGYFISAHGHVVTNYHVIRPTVEVYTVHFPAPVERIRVVQNSGTPKHQSYDGTVILADKENDLAVLATGANGTPHLRLGIAEKLIETSPVWILGYPFGSTFSVIQRGPEITVSRGDVSALRHDDRGELTTIQIDAAINPGNSGGPVVTASGMLVGTVKNILGASRVNMAIPVHYLDSLSADIPADTALPDSALLSVTTGPPGARVLVDWSDAGSAPLKHHAMPAGWHTLCAAKTGFEMWINELSCLGTCSHDIVLGPWQKVPVVHASRTPRTRPPSQTLESIRRNAAEKLVHETFDNPDNLVQWEQYTGGTDKRTWFIDEGALHQFESDEILHAICLGDTSWRDYAVFARMRITDEHDDSRAGIIVRETGNGFYLFRIHKETDKAQLAYHCKHPFGWFILQEKKLGRDIGEEWYDASVAVRGNRIACFLDGRPVFSAHAQYAPQGRIGFYSVESKASFDSLVVHELPSPDTPAAPRDTPRILSFWFSDFFTTESVWWHQYAGASREPAPWYFSDAGCAQLRDDTTTRRMEMTRYLFSDFGTSLVVSLGAGQNKASFAVVFRKTDDAFARIRFLKREERVLLEVRRGGRLRAVRNRPLSPQVFENSTRLGLNVHGDEVVLRANDLEVLRYHGKHLPEGPGTIGFTTTGVRAVLHQMTVASPVVD